MDQMHQHRDGIKSSLKEAKVRSLTRFNGNSSELSQPGKMETHAHQTFSGSS